MTLKIYKFYFPIQDEVVLHLPLGAKVLTVQVQNEKVCLWALVDVDTTLIEKRFFWVVGTGNPTPEGIEKMAYVASVQLRGGMLVFHIFEKVAPKS